MLPAIGAATVVISFGWAIGWFWHVGTVRLAPKLARIHRCSRTHPDWTHEQWVAWVAKPVTARWYARHGLESRD